MLKEKIYQYFQENDKHEEQKDITFAPSYISDCKRKIYYKKKAVEPTNPIDEAGYFKMKLGSSSHEMIQNVLKEIGTLKECEDMKNITWQGLEWKYRLDGILEIDKKDYIIEIKTVYAAGFRAIEQKPRPEHLRQLLMYMLFEEIDKGIILYVGRDNGFMIEYIYDVDHLIDLKQELISHVNELKTLKVMIENNNMPDRDYQIQLKNMGDSISDDFQMDKVKYKTDWHCLYCQWKNGCWREELDRIADYKFYINGEFIEG